MPPDNRYPNGYVRMQNQNQEYLNRSGVPSTNLDETHIPIEEFNQLPELPEVFFVE
jgi:hypothetical protein